MHEEQLPTAHFQLGPRTRLLIGLGAFSMLLVAVLATTLIGLTRLTSATHQAIEVDGVLSELANEVTIESLLCRRYEKDLFLNVGDTAERAAYFGRWASAVDRLAQAIDRFEQAADGDADRALVRLWREELVRYRAAIQQIEQQIADGQITTPQAANAALEPYKNTIRNLTETALETVQRKVQATKQSEARVHQLSTRITWLTLIIGGLALAVALIWSWGLFVRLVHPVVALRQAAQQLAGGDLSARAPQMRDDEIGLLARSFNHMAETIQQRTTDLELKRDALQAASERQQQLLITVQQLSAPLLPLSEGVLALPIVGYVDAPRAAALLETLLHGIDQRRARHVILDLTGLSALDAAAMHFLQQAVQAGRLLGAHVALAGVSAAMAQMIVEQGLRLGQVRTYRDLHSAVEAALLDVPALGAASTLRWTTG